MTNSQRLSKSRGEPQGARARSGLRVPLPVALVGLGVMAAAAPAQANFPRLVADAYTTPMGTPLTANVLTNDYVSVSRDDATPVNVPRACLEVLGIAPRGTVDGSFAQGPTHGTATIQPDGNVTYTPDLGFVGVDTFKYAVRIYNIWPQDALTIQCNGYECVAIEVSVTVTEPAPAPAVVTAVPTLAPVALGGLGAALGLLGMRRRRRRD